MIILQNILSSVIGSVLLNISPSLIFPITFMSERFHPESLPGLGCSKHQWFKCCIDVHSPKLRVTNTLFFIDSPEFFDVLQEGL